MDWNNWDFGFQSSVRINVGPNWFFLQGEWRLGSVSILRED